MQTLRRWLRPLTWLALVAMLGLGLLPMASHALAWVDREGSWAEVCTPRGVARVATGESPADTGGPLGAITFEHCPYCAQPTGPVGLPPSLRATQAVPSTSEVLSRDIRQAPATWTPWTAAQPRAPPARA